MGSGKNKAGKTGRVVNLEKEKYKRLVMKTFDDIAHKERRDQAERRSEVERKAKRRW